MTGELSIAVHAIVYLNHINKKLSSEALAENICTNPARIRKVLSKLKKAGLIQTKEGLEGGYYFDKNPSEVDLSMISEAIRIEFINQSWKSGNQNMECLVASGMAEVMDHIYSDLNHECRNHLKTISVADLDHIIFKDNHISPK